MSKFHPKVSIIIPVYNGANYLNQAIDSALAQTYDNTEIIVVNDGSSDNGLTDKIAKSYGNKIRYYKKENGGVSTALNFAIDKMRGEYFSWLSHDDLYKKDKVQRQVDFLNTLPNKNSVIYADYELINEKGDLIDRCIYDHDLLEQTPIYSLLRGAINGITMLVPLKAFQTHGRFDESLKCAQDYDMWFRLLKDYPFVHQQAVLTQTRIHIGQGTVANPAAVTEGNDLWIHMIDSISDDTKRKAEGNLFTFYFEMVKFLKNTQYDRALQHCIAKLEDYSGSNEASLVDYGTSRVIIRTINDLINEDLKISSALFTANILTQLNANNKRDISTTVIKESLIGDLDDIVSTSKAEKYLSKAVAAKKKKRILFCSGYWLTGGVERVLSILFEQLKDEYEVFLITPYDGRESNISVPSYVCHIMMSDNNYGKYDTVVLSYTTMLKIDVVIGTMNWESKQLAIYDMCASLGIKTIASNHEIFFYPYLDINLQKIIDKRISSFKNVDAVLWPTNFSAAAYGLMAGNSYLMPNPNTFSIKSPRISQEENIILCVGRFTDYVKRIDRILQCFSIVSKKIPNAKLVLVGKYENDVEFMPADNRSVNDLIKEFGIDKSRIEFVGEVDHIEKYYSKATLLLVTSNNEGFCMVVNEAACYGVPTVSTKIPGLEDLIEDGQNGYIVEQDDIVALASKIETLLANKVLRDQMGNYAIEHVNKFDRSVVGSRWKYLIDTVTSSKTNAKDIETTLRKKLDYKVENYRSYSKLLMSEMDKIVAMVQNGAVREDLGRARKENDYLRNEIQELGDSLAKIKNSKRWIVTSRVIDLTVGKLRRISGRQGDI